MYAMGWTQHTVGVQNIRTMAIIQLLLGNMGVAGGGVNALRVNPMCRAPRTTAFCFTSGRVISKPPGPGQTTLGLQQKIYPQTNDPLSANWWGNYPKYSVSLLKSYFGDKATQENEFGYDWMPKLDDGNTYSWLDLFDAMYRGDFTGFFAWGQNPAAPEPTPTRPGTAWPNWTGW
jgi:formate dehydrogenase major subunit